MLLLGSCIFTKIPALLDCGYIPTYGLYTLDTLTHGRVPNAHPNVSSEGEQERMAFFVCSLVFLYLSLILFTLLWK